MKFSTETRISPDVYKDDIPIIHGTNYYINEEQYVATFNKTQYTVFDQNGNRIVVQSIKPVTEFIYIINQKLAYRTSIGFLVTNISATKEKYVGGFQGIVGFDEATVDYSYINNNTDIKSDVILTGRINASKQLEIYLPTSQQWIVPLGEFRCFIADTFYNIGYDAIMPNSFGDEFNVTLVGFKNASVTPTTNYIRDMFISGNTLYLSTRLNIIGSQPYNWNVIDTSDKSVIWTEDSRLNGCYFCGSSASNQFFLVNYNTSYIYWVSGVDLSVLQEYQHKLPILGVGSIDKFSIAVVDKEACSILSAYVSLNTWLIKAKIYFPFNQMSAYEDMVTNYLREEVVYVQDLDALVISSSQRMNMILYIVNNKVLSCCHTESFIVPGDYSAYIIDNNVLYKYTKVEDSGEYTVLNYEEGNIMYDSFIYIGSDLEPDVGGSTFNDTEIKFEGKIVILDGDQISVESSADTPKDEFDLPIRTEQNNPENQWYLYTKTLRYPVSYTDWLKIGLMPTTKIFTINLAENLTDKSQSKSKSKKK